MPNHYAVRNIRGPAWDDSRPLREQVLWAEHAAFIDALTAEGFVVLGGPLGGAAGALLIVSAESEETVRARLGPDPWYKSGHLQIGSIDEWTILLNAGHL